MLLAERARCERSFRTLARHAEPEPIEPEFWPEVQARAALIYPAVTGAAALAKLLWSASVGPARMREADVDALLAGLSNHLHRFDLHRRRAQYVGLVRSPVFGCRRSWLLHRPRHFHLLVDIGRPIGLR